MLNEVGYGFLRSGRWPRGAGRLQSERYSAYLRGPILPRSFMVQKDTHLGRPNRST